MNEAVTAAIIGLLGVVAGSLITAFVNYFTNRMLIQRGELEWQRQREEALRLRTIEEQKQLDERKMKYSERIVEIYQKSIQSLMLLSSSKDTEISLSNEDRKELLNEAANNLAMLHVHLRSTEQAEIAHFDNLYTGFLASPSDFSAPLLDAVLELSRVDNILYPNLNAKEKFSNERNIHIHIDESFREEQFRGGNELPAEYVFSCDLANLNENHREKIWKLYLHNSSLPKQLILNLPDYNDRNHTIREGAIVWKAKLNPLEESPRDIFDAWLNDYENALNEAYRQQGRATNSQ